MISSLVENATNNSTMVPWIGLGSIVSLQTPSLLRTVAMFRVTGTPSKLLLLLRHSVFPYGLLKPRFPQVYKNSFGGV